MRKLCLFNLLLIVIIYFKRYPDTYCLMQGRCIICSNLYNLINIYKYLAQQCVKDVAHTLKKEYKIYAIYFKIR